MRYVGKALDRIKILWILSISKIKNNEKEENQQYQVFSRKSENKSKIMLFKQEKAGVKENYIYIRLKGGHKLC